MKLLFKQKAFSWLDSFNVYNENEEVVYRVEGKIAFGHHLVVYDASGYEVAQIQEKVLSFLPVFYMYKDGIELGSIKKEFTFFRPKFILSCNDWVVNGDIMEWDYDVVSTNRTIMHVEKKFRFIDTYELNIVREEDALLCLLIVLAIDAAKCSQGK